MTTLVGTQQDLEDAIKELIELEYDAIGAYELAIKKLDNLAYIDILKGFLSDHKGHVVKIKEFYKGTLSLPMTGDLVKGSLAKFKVTIGNMIGQDLNILKAMLTNEEDTNTAYERMTKHKGVSNNPALELILKSALEDEIRHKAWLESETA
ncbi:MAG: hypothetical protein K0R14_2155 [Burkholderiales bacterium]|jgi:rubrerythrin|nr:hypothetical protein [Burkholderiales bacterium]